MVVKVVKVVMVKEDDDDGMEDDVGFVLLGG